MEKDKEFFQRFAHARETGHDAIADECLEIIDTEAEIAESVSRSGSSTHRDSAHVAWMKNRVEMRLKLLAKWNPKKYGDKVGIEHSGSVALDAAILEARKRVKQPE
jgi:hypothetical protein